MSSPHPPPPPCLHKEKATLCSSCAHRKKKETVDAAVCLFDELAELQLDVKKERDRVAGMVEEREEEEQGKGVVEEKSERRGSCEVAGVAAPSTLYSGAARRRLTMSARRAADYIESQTSYYQSRETNTLRDDRGVVEDHPMVRLTATTSSRRSRTQRALLASLLTMFPLNFTTPSTLSLCGVDFPSSTTALTPAQAQTLSLLLCPLLVAVQSILGIPYTYPLRVSQSPATTSATPSSTPRLVGSSTNSDSATAQSGAEVDVPGWSWTSVGGPWQVFVPTAERAQYEAGARGLLFVWEEVVCQLERWQDVTAEEGRPADHLLPRLLHALRAPPPC
uniref:Uncharacterized protein n=1 Tax=Sexangularia sp. CB-2014 TaxID=1486929 RepID=A0A7S1V7P1_9EUKA